MKSFNADRQPSSSSLSGWRLTGWLGLACSTTVLLAACGGGGGATDTAALADVPEGTPVVVKLAPATSFQLSGAIFTTNSACDGTDLNIYDLKTDVYLDGGPRKAGSAGLPDGQYFVMVTDPSGATVLGKTPTASVTVAGGEVIGCPQLWTILKQPDASDGYADTPNNGGEYKVWISKNALFPPNESKTDNFEVDKNVVTPPTGQLVVIKFYDANLNGQLDAGESEMLGWKVNIDPVIGDQFTPYSALVTPGPYSIKEYMPTQTNWLPTTGLTQTTTVLLNGTSTVAFGNVCLAGGGGKTLGYWSNKNGQAQVGSDDLAMLSGLNLVDGAGTAFDPGNYAALRTWLLNGTAVNMAYMLSVQLAAMELNVYNGLVSGASLVYAPGVPGASALGFITVTDLMKVANDDLGSFGHNVTIGSGTIRSTQEAIKNALDNANNNRNFLSATPCEYTFTTP